MFETQQRLIDFRQSKTVLWAHNSHLGDARATEMGMNWSEINLGQLCRERLTGVAIVGCGTHDGTVAAAHDWDGEMEVMKVNSSREDSWEAIAHATRVPRFLLDMRRCDAQLAKDLAEERLERFIGVIYRAAT